MNAAASSQPARRGRQHPERLTEAAARRPRLPRPARPRGQASFRPEPTAASSISTASAVAGHGGGDADQHVVGAGDEVGHADDDPDHRRIDPQLGRRRSAAR